MIIGRESFCLKMNAPARLVACGCTLLSGLKIRPNTLDTGIPRNTQQKSTTGRRATSFGFSPLFRLHCPALLLIHQHQYYSSSGTGWNRIVPPKMVDLADRDLCVWGGGHWCELEMEFELLERPLATVHGIWIDSPSDKSPYSISYQRDDGSEEWVLLKDNCMRSIEFGDDDDNDAVIILRSSDGDCCGNRRTLNRAVIRVDFMPSSWWLDNTQPKKQVKYGKELECRGCRDGLGCVVKRWTAIVLWSIFSQRETMRDYIYV